jgi:RHS repeat-associated protein
LEYDPVDQLVGATLRDSVAGTLLKRFVYGYDHAGNRTSESVGTSSASSVSSAKVNHLNQLTNTVAGSGPVRFTGYLNEPGQSVTVGTNAAQIKQTTNFTGSAELAVGTNTVAVKATDYSGNSTTNSYQIVVTNNGVAKTLKYDLNGNLTNAFTVTETNVYEWDGADRMVAVNVMTASATNRSEFTYDGLGRRTRILELTNGVGQSTNVFMWVGTELSEERDSTGATVTKRFFEQGEQISGTAYFYTRDHLGSIREMTDGSGNVRARYDFDPYGRKTKISGDLEASFGYTGHYWHQNSRLWLTLHRAYDSETARWISRDPIAEEGGLNLYAYVNNNPINGIDPLGLAVYPPDFVGPLLPSDVRLPQELRDNYIAARDYLNNRGIKPGGKNQASCWGVNSVVGMFMGTPPSGWERRFERRERWAGDQTFGLVNTYYDHWTIVYTAPTKDKVVFDFWGNLPPASPYSVFRDKYPIFKRDTHIPNDNKPCNYEYLDIIDPAHQ